MIVKSMLNAVGSCLIVKAAKSVIPDLFSPETVINWEKVNVFADLDDAVELGRRIFNVFIVILLIIAVVDFVRAIFSMIGDSFTLKKREGRGALSLLIEALIIGLAAFLVSFVPDMIF
ncbi:hypothetical protein JW710_03370 [Candidatus Dojkabacteria bacterium]|nr:hypothetical protein [Candidatus Dojkabacteria bacterium]